MNIILTRKSSINGVFLKYKTLFGKILIDIFCNFVYSILIEAFYFVFISFLNEITKEASVGREVDAM